MFLLLSKTTALLAAAVPAVTPLRTFSSDAVAVTPSRMFNSAAVAATAVLPRTSCPSGITILAAPLRIRSSADVSHVIFAEAVSP